MKLLLLDLNSIVGADDQKIIAGVEQTIAAGIPFMQIEEWRQRR